MLFALFSRLTAKQRRPGPFAADPQIGQVYFGSYGLFLSKGTLGLRYGKLGAPGVPVICCAMPVVAHAAAVKKAVADMLKLLRFMGSPFLRVSVTGAASPR
jgi:hypothetical protein